MSDNTPEAPQDGDPAVTQEQAPIDTTATVEAETKTDGAPAEADAPAAKDAPVKEPWFVKRLHQQSAKIADMGRERELLLSALAEARKSQQADAPVEGEAPAATSRAAVADVPQTDVERRAQQIVEAREFNATCDRIYHAGKDEYGADFDAAVKNLAMVGAINPNERTAFLDAVTALSDPAKILHTLGKDPDEAQRIASLPPIKQAVELAKLENSLARKAPPISKAPAPIRPVGGAARLSGELSDKDSIDDWMKKRSAQREARRR